MIGRGALLACALALSGCEMSAYYLQAVRGHLDIIDRAQPLDALLTDAEVPAPLRQRLETATRIREFASRELRLPDNGSYRSYADLGRPYAVWNVVAAPEFSLLPVQSCFPVAGCVSYRGFYAREDAERHAARLRDGGHDVFVGGVLAYSTLGWFDDPLLSTFIRYTDSELARLVFHELAHQVLYVQGDTSFNESFAVAVEREGVRRWLLARGSKADIAAFAAAQVRAGEFATLMADTRRRLQTLYAEDLPPQQKRVRKADAFRTLQAEYAVLKQGRWNGFAGYDRFLAEATPNNALLASFATYSQHVDAFARLLAAEGGDLARFYERVREIGALDRPARDAWLAAN